MLIHVLGPVEVRTANGWQRLSAPKWRTLLARLTMSIGSPVSVDALVDELWPDDPPAGAVNQVHGYVSRLRGLIGDRGRTVLATRSPGYELMIGDDDLDSRRFERLTDQGEQALRNTENARAAELFAEALELWQGPAYADVPPSELISAEADRLTERRLRAQEGRIDADLGRGRPAAELVTELQAAVAAHPLREHLWCQLMLALYRSDRQSDALLAYQDAYHRLDSELGVQPGAALTELHQRVLAGDPALAAPTPEAGPAAARTAAPESDEVPRQLAADISDFTGRTDELSALDDWLAEADSDTPGPPALALSGGGGFGKTTLGLHWAHQVADRFPDGQLYVNLRGFANAAPLPPEQALAAFLRALGEPPDRIPVDRDEAAALYRTRMSNRRMLVMLDNAADDDQVLPLLPGSGANRVLITSRDPLPGLVARGLVRQLRVGALPASETEALLARIVGRSRLAAEPDAATRLARICAGLPLATRITAAHLAGNPGLPVAEHVAELEDGGSTSRLAALDLDPARPDDPSASVRAAFDLSFGRLGSPSRQLFMLLSVIPGDSFSAPAAAALVDSDPASVRKVLDQLWARGMLGYTEPGRYALHDLLQAYASDRCRDTIDPAEQSSAERRLFAWYVATAAQAVDAAGLPMFRVPDPLPTASPAIDLEDQSVAATWLDAERPQLLALAVAAERDPDRPVWQLADVLRAYFFHQSYPADWLAVAEAGRRSAHRIGHTMAEAAAELNLTQAYRRISRYAEATRHADRGRELAERSGWEMGAGAIWNELAVLRMEQGDIRSAPELLQRAIDIYRRLGNHAAEASLLINLGQATRQLGDLTSAAWQLTAALQLLPAEAGYPAVLVHAELSEIHWLMGRHGQARAELDRAIAVLHGGFLGTASVCAIRSEQRAADGDFDGALADAEQALELARKQQSERLQASGLLARADVRIAAADPVAALADAAEVEEITRRTNAGYEWVQSLVRVARAQVRIGKAADARQTAARAAAEADGYGYRIERAQAESVLAEAELQLGHRALARKSARHAIALYQETGCRLGEQELVELMASS